MRLMRYVPVAAFLVVIALIAAITVTPVAADDWYQNINLAGPTSGSVDDTLSYRYSGQHCTGYNPNNPNNPPAGNLPSGGSAVCGPISDIVHFDVVGPTSRSGDLPVTSTGVAGIDYQFTKAGQYTVQANIPGHPETFQSITVNIQSTATSPTPTTPSPTEGQPTGGAGGATSTQTPTASTSGIEGIASQAEAATGLGSNALIIVLAVIVIVLLAIIATALLMRRRD